MTISATGKPGGEGGRAGEGEGERRREGFLSFSSHIRRLNGWMTCDFTSFSAVFQSYQDVGWMIMKG